MKVKDLINELNLNKVDQLLTVKIKGGWRTNGQAKWYTTYTDWTTTITWDGNW